MSVKGEMATPSGGRESAPEIHNGFGLVVCFIVLLLDGFDTTSIAFVAPVLAGEWNIPVSALTPAFVATSVGAVIGYVTCGPLTQRLGTPVVGAGCVALFGFGTLSLAVAWDVASLSALRFFSAIGLGGAVPIAIVAATHLVADRRKETAIMLVASGLSAGAVTAGLLGGPLLRAYGWEAVFITGGLLPLVALPFFVRVLRASAPQVDGPSRQRTGSSLFAQLFSGSLAGLTALLWTFSFLIFVVTHALIFWTPSLLLEFGFEHDQAPLGTAAFGTGGLVGNLFMATIVASVGTKRMLAIFLVFTMGCIVAISQFDISMTVLLLLIAGLGAGTITGCLGEAVLAVIFYPPHLRETGVGCATAMGRVGSILGPAVGGLLVSLDWPARDVFLTALIPTSLALVVLSFLGLMLRQPAVSR
jgi:MFS transporter, AAHS family, 4-hydroxybenzoate transporter